ncbi:MAG: hypothetical protein CVV51_09470 [Spirochaetae bacterium HGW-Spirochaetae-7]|jgi:two-component sensor histidine kinase|nr:MAG: hypothetical protein CVV51_09470 [Spirochaetae bacterium HGW-Spirochaetae-7]
MRSSGGARLKRIIILPFFIIISVGFALSWGMYVYGSRIALGDAVSSIMTASSERIAEEIAKRFESAAHAAGTNAAFLGTILGDPVPNPLKPTEIRKIFLEQLRLDMGLAILALGTEDGEYQEAQRQPGEAFRVGSAGVSTAGALVFRPVLEDDSFGAPNQSVPGYDPRNRPWYKAAISAAGPAWSAPYTLYSNADLAVAATAPVFRAGSIIGVVSATITLGTLSEYLSVIKEAEHGVIYVTDSVDMLIASSSAPILDREGKRTLAWDNPDPLVAAIAEAVNQAAPRAATASRSRFSFRLNGNRYLGRAVPFAPNLDLDWTIVIAVEERSYAEKLLEADIRNFVLFVLFLVASFVVGWFVVDDITKPIRALADGVDAFRPGAAIPAELTAFATHKNEFGKLSRSFLAMKIRLDESFGAIEASLAEKEVLLKEVHHRVKNNLQVVSSILSIQSGTIADEAAKKSFDECQDRIQAMAFVHEEVYRTGSFVELGMSDYLRRICESLRQGRLQGACDTSFSVEVNDEAALSLDKAIPCGLIVNELVTNSLKHAFNGRELGSVSVSFHRDGPAWRLAVADDGVGMNADGRAELAGASGTANMDGIGHQLVEGLVVQLRGTITYDATAGGGTSVSVTFPA